MIDLVTWCWRVVRALTPLPCPFPPGLRRCAGGGAALPQPALSLEADGPLQYDEAQWEQGWVSQGGEQAYSVRLAVTGHPG